ncbi:MAG: hypothetical protein IT471_09310 [Pseudomonadales bacterium]|jgi:hypothetical protein|nr:hypothetical protein [Pseudomonadales bacterium]MCP5333255.1 hypothetical protein [Pseudomonadales bacterium]HMU91119.1 hypothetical protein [Pseudomonadales bacterium]HMW16029.1 hypothetical protein [Pseudomonadales bacterium]HMW83468.1 hypothetical protein [Pseudomonadales bacterium]
MSAASHWITDLHCASRPAALLADADWAAACLGGALPEAVEAALRAAGSAYADDDLAERHLLQASALAPDHPAVLIAWYRFCFYKGRLMQARELGLRCLTLAARGCGLPESWQTVSATAARFDDFAAVAERFYLFSLKGCAYLSLRLGDLSLGQAMLAKLRELDPADRLGGAVLEQVLARRGADDDE